MPDEHEQGQAGEEALDRERRGPVDDGGRIPVRQSAIDLERSDGGVITDVEGSAYRTGTAEFALDPHDSLGTGFLLR